VSARAASVLTVEDNPITRAELRLVLEDAGFDVVADARDGIEAVELARQHQPDVVLLDLGLPRLDGVDATHQILAERAVAIVAVTGRSRTLAERALAAGAASYLLKPFAETDLVRAVSVALAAHRERRERELRSESLHSLEQLLGLLGYPADWAVELERRAWNDGHVWRAAAPGAPREGS
jgi:two-component system, response regulator PdtaR